MNKIKESVTIVAKNIIAHWNTPAPGKYVSYKELTAYSVGGMGVQFVLAMFYQIAMASTCWLTGIVYGLKPVDMSIVLNVATAISIIFQPIKAALIDNAKTRSGKARPWIFWMGPPTAILIALVPFIDPNWDYLVKLLLIGGAYILLNIIANFYNGQYLQLAQLITPDTDERAAVISISSIAYSLAPTITGFVIPMLASGFDLGLRDKRVYQIAMPIFSLIGLAMGYISYFGTKEKVVQSKQVKEKVKFFEGMKKIAGNRYFWIINIGNIFLIFRNAISTILNWIWVYMLQNDAISAPLITLMGTASLIGMAASPFLCKFIGKKYTYLLSNTIMLVASILIIFVIKWWYITFILIYLINMCAALQIITNPAMAGEALDYQQWKTGDRMEGFSGNFAIITSIIALGTNLIIPAVQQNLGLLENYDILFDATIREPIFRAMAIISVIGAVLNTIPYLFWNMTEKKHKAMIEDLKQRAIAEDKAAGEEETADELEARLAGITVEQLLAERERAAQAKAELASILAGENTGVSASDEAVDNVLDTTATDAAVEEDNKNEEN